MRTFEELNRTEKTQAKKAIAAELCVAIAELASDEVKKEPAQRSRVMLRRDQFLAVRQALAAAEGGRALEALTTEIARAAHYPDEAEPVVWLTKGPTRLTSYPEEMPSAQPWAVEAIRSNPDLLTS